MSFKRFSVLGLALLLLSGLGLLAFGFHGAVVFLAFGIALAFAARYKRTPAKTAERERMIWDTVMEMERIGFFITPRAILRSSTIWQGLGRVALLVFLWPVPLLACVLRWEMSLIKRL